MPSPPDAATAPADAPAPPPAAGPAALPQDATTLLADAGPAGDRRVLMPGRVFGDYDILEELARGGMGVVYRARQRSLHRVVALKVLLEGEGAGAAQVRRFQREASSAARLAHPGIVQVHEVGVRDGIHYFSMELVEGRTLLQLIEAEQPSPRRAADLLRRVAEALAYAHVQGILHRDIKPQNILVDREDRPRLSDFGLVKDFAQDSRLTASGVVLGTPMYMSPEQARGDLDAMDRRSDVFSLGAVLYHALAGRPPFEAGGALSVLHRVIHEEPAPIRGLAREVHRDLETICLKALAKEPEGRYPTAGELAEDLGRFLEGQPIRARPPSAAARVARWVARNRWLAAVVAVAFLLLALQGVRAARADARRTRATELASAARATLQSLAVEIWSTRPPSHDGTRTSAEAEVAWEATAAGFRSRFARCRVDLRQARELAPDARLVLEVSTEAALQNFDLDAAKEASERLERGWPEDPCAQAYCLRVLADADRFSPHERAEALEAARKAAAVAGRVGGGAGAGVARLAKARLALLGGRAAEALEALAGAEYGTAVPVLAADAARTRAEAYALDRKPEGYRAGFEDMERVFASGQGGYGDYLLDALRSSRAQDERRAWLALDRALAYLGPPHAIRVERVRLLRERGDAEAAIRECERALAEGPEHAMLFLDRGELRALRGDWSGAEADYRRGAELSPGAALPFARQLQLVERRAGADAARAWHDERKARGEVVPGAWIVTDPRGFSLIVLALFRVGLPEEAERLLESGLRRSPEEVVALKLRGRLRLSRQDWAGALADFEAARRRGEPDARLEVLRWTGLSGRKDWKGAWAAISEAIRLKSDDEGLYVKRASTRLQLADLKGALGDIEEAALLSDVATLEGVREDLLETRRFAPGAGTAPAAVEGAAATSLAEAEEESRPAARASWVADLGGELRKFARMLLPALSDGLAERGETALANGDLERAAAAFERAKVADPSKGRPQYGFARVCARRREWELAAFRLVAALERGYGDAARVEAEADFGELRARPEFATVRRRLDGDR
ncbi:MAG: protein kinase [Planctomycetes bacterium]|nr:protein kinase [Planctomycetota bacterium]